MLYDAKANPERAERHLRQIDWQRGERIGRSIGEVTKALAHILVVMACLKYLFT